jgi:hypothetical protein
MTRIMRRWPLRILLCLVLGAITTVAVAWGCARWSLSIEQLETITWPYPPDEVSQYDYALLDERGVEFRDERKVARSGAEGFGFRRADYWELPEGWFDDRGFSMLALNCDERFSNELRESLIDSGSEYSHRDYYLLGGGFDIIQLRSFAGLEDWPVARPIPFHPIWPGLLIDTLFYTAIWFGVFFAPGMAKRAIRGRRKRGRCPRCGYDLRGNLSAGCSECGWNREESAA